MGERVKIEPIVEAFNLFNVTNVLGFSKSNYSGFSNVLVRDSNDPTSPGFLRSSSFGQPVTTAGGVFGSGGPRAFQFAARSPFEPIEITLSNRPRKLKRQMGSALQRP